MTSVLTWLLNSVLNWLLARATKAVADVSKEMADAKEQGQINDENVKRYEAARDRAERIKAATDLLNGTHAP